MGTTDKEKLWKEYIEKPTPELREQIILEYAQLVKIVAGKLSIYLGGNVEYEDLVGYGIFGLIDAIDKFNVNRDVKERLMRLFALSKKRPAEALTTKKLLPSLASMKTNTINGKHSSMLPM